MKTPMKSQIIRNGRIIDPDATGAMKWRIFLSLMANDGQISDQRSAISNRN